MQLEHKCNNNKNYQKISSNTIFKTKMVFENETVLDTKNTEF